ncbi:MAG: tetratricopeptide repeat protein [Gemmatimonadaceae bacterium]|nr:tetratricopeptide repeat protein [Gemmatimonadaceae bacterium]
MQPTRPTEHSRRNVRFLALPLILAGCIASKSDVTVLQQDIMLVRAEAAQSDSARRQEIQRVMRSMQSLTDSVSAVATRLTRMRTDMQGRFSAIEDDTRRLQEIAGQSQARMQELRAAVESRTSAPPSSASPSAGAPAVVPGPNQLYQLGRDQLLRGSTAAARTAFEDLLARYPESDVAAEAQFYIGETHAAEGNVQEADQAYARVASAYPRSPRAATATYKRAVAAEGARRTREARQLYNEVISKFPRSDEAALARDRLRDLQ